MMKKKEKKPTPKLENTGKLLAAAIGVPLISSLLMYMFLTMYSTSPPTMVKDQKTKIEDVK